MDFLTKKFPYRDTSGWQQQIETERILLNGRPSDSNQVLTNGDLITYITLREEEPVTDQNFKILYDDPWLLGIEKSGNIPVTRSGKYVFSNLLHIVREQLGNIALYAVQRLDRETSGAVIFAKTKEAAAKMTDIISGYEHKKKYIAVLNGATELSGKTVDAPLGKLPGRSTVRIRQFVHDAGKPAKTDFRFRHSFSNLTLADIVTYTGRTHQIRCHAEYIGLPIVGDKLYGVNDNTFVSYITGCKQYDLPHTGPVSRQLLHAAELSFIHPYTGAEIQLHSDYYPFFSHFPKIAFFLDSIKDT